jgi:hypothetical protein
MLNLTKIRPVGIELFHVGARAHTARCVHPVKNNPTVTYKKDLYTHN